MKFIHIVMTLLPILSQILAAEEGKDFGEIRSLDNTKVNLNSSVSAGAEPETSIAAPPRRGRTSRSLKDIFGSMGQESVLEPDMADPPTPSTVVVYSNPSPNNPPAPYGYTPPYPPYGGMPLAGYGARPAAYAPAQYAPALPAPPQYPPYPQPGYGYGMPPYGYGMYPPGYGYPNGYDLAYGASNQMYGYVATDKPAESTTEKPKTKKGKKKRRRLKKKIYYEPECSCPDDNECDDCNTGCNKGTYATPAPPPYGQAPAPYSQPTASAPYSQHGHNSHSSITIESKPSYKGDKGKDGHEEGLHSITHVKTEPYKEESHGDYKQNKYPQNTRNNYYRQPYAHLPYQRNYPHNNHYSHENKYRRPTRQQYQPVQLPHRTVATGYSSMYPPATSHHPKMLRVPEGASYSHVSHNAPESPEVPKVPNIPRVPEIPTVPHLTEEPEAPNYNYRPKTTPPSPPPATNDRYRSDAPEGREVQDTSQIQKYSPNSKHRDPEPPRNEHSLGKHGEILAVPKIPGSSLPESNLPIHKVTRIVQIPLGESKPYAQVAVSSASKGTEGQQAPQGQQDQYPQQPQKYEQHQQRQQDQHQQQPQQYEQHQQRQQDQQQPQHYEQRQQGQQDQRHQQPQQYEQHDQRQQQPPENDQRQQGQPDQDVQPPQQYEQNFQPPQNQQDPQIQQPQQFPNLQQPQQPPHLSDIRQPVRPLLPPQIEYPPPQIQYPPPIEYPPPIDYPRIEVPQMPEIPSFPEQFPVPDPNPMPIPPEMGANVYSQGNQNNNFNNHEGQAPPPQHPYNNNQQYSQENVQPNAQEQHQEYLANTPPAASYNVHTQQSPPSFQEEDLQPDFSHSFPSYALPNPGTQPSALRYNEQGPGIQAAPSGYHFQGPGNHAPAPPRLPGVEVIPNLNDSYRQNPIHVEEGQVMVNFQAQE